MTTSAANATLRMTEKREEWLRLLESGGPRNREGFGAAPRHCMRLGWTRWVDPVPPRGTPRVEEITDEGREALRLLTEDDGAQRR